MKGIKKSQRKQKNEKHKTSEKRQTHNYTSKTFHLADSSAVLISSLSLVNQFMIGEYKGYIMSTLFNLHKNLISFI